MRYGFGPTRTTFYERRKKQLGTNDSRATNAPAPPSSNYLVTQAGTGFNLVTQAGDRITTQS